MALYCFKKDTYYTLLKIFGITIYEDFIDYTSMDRKQTFFNGLVSTYKTSDIYNIKIQKSITVCGLKFLNREDDEDKQRWYLFNFLIRTRDFRSEFKKRVLKSLPEGIDDIYMLNANSGETYLFLRYLFESFSSKHNSKTPLIIATKKYHIQLINMLCPKVKHIYIPKIKYFPKGYSFEIDKHKVYVMFPMFHFVDVEQDIKNKPIGESHYFSSMIKHLGLTDGDIRTREIILTPDVERSMLEKVQKLGLNIDNFVFVAPEALSCIQVKNEYWAGRINEFHRQGLDVFVNITNPKNEIENCEYKSCFLSYSEAFALAKHSKKIVSLRSGLTEFLMATGVEMEVLYTPFRNRFVFKDLPVEPVMSGFSLSKLPHDDSQKVEEKYIGVCNE